MIVKGSPLLAYDSANKEEDRKEPEMVKLNESEPRCYKNPLGIFFFFCLALELAASLARLAGPIVTALAVGGALVNVAAIAGQSTAGDVASAAVVDAGTLHKVGRVEHSGVGTGTDRENLGGILGLDSDSEGEDRKESDGFREHVCLFVWLQIVV